MKKLLLTCSLIVSSCFFAGAQIQVGGVNVNVGRVCGTISGRPACINPSTGQWEIVTGNGTGVGGNVNTGQVGGSGTIGGVRVNGVFGGDTTQGVKGVTDSQAAGTALGLLGLAQTFVARSVPLLIGVALLAFFWFLIEFIWKGKDSPDEQSKAKTGMFWAILALFVMISIWGIIGFLGSVFGIGQGGSIPGFRLPGK